MTDYTESINVPCSKCGKHATRPAAWFRSSEKLVLACPFCGNDISVDAQNLAVLLYDAAGNITEFFLKSTGRK